MAQSERVQQFLAMRDSFAPTLKPLMPVEPNPVSAGPMVGGGGLAGPMGVVGPNGLIDWRGIKINGRTLPYVNALAKQFSGLRPTSGWRDPQHNRRVGGVPNSHHLDGSASDWVGSAREMHDAKLWAERNGAREVLVHNVGSGMHLHVAW